jgi:hypothetical protein
MGPIQNQPEGKFSYLIKTVLSRLFKKKFYILEKSILGKYEVFTEKSLPRSLLIVFHTCTDSLHLNLKQILNLH